MSELEHRGHSRDCYLFTAQIRRWNRLLACFWTLLNEWLLGKLHLNQLNPQDVMYRSALCEGQNRALSNCAGQKLPAKQLRIARSKIQCTCAAELPNLKCLLSQGRHCLAMREMRRAVIDRRQQHPQHHFWISTAHTTTLWHGINVKESVSKWGAHCWRDGRYFCFGWVCSQPGVMLGCAYMGHG